MSENIQSIANGTYVIGETSATNFIAGNGIKIDEPSAGTVRIGNDETVLFESSAGAYMKDGITLSENMNNFEVIKFYMAALSDQTGIVYEILPNGLSDYFSIQPPFSFGNTTGTGYAINWKVTIHKVNNTLTSVQSVYWGKSGTDGATAGTWVQGANNNVPVVYKVIGINRISGSNA